MIATLNGTAVTRARVQVPAWGAWWADVDLEQDVTLAGRVVLTLADITLSGTVISGGPFDGRASYRIAAGAGGWGKEIPPLGYSDDGGVRAAKVIADSAVVCGEIVQSLPSTRLGPHFARARGAASRVLNTVVPRAWHVGFDGITRCSARPVAAYAGPSVRENQAPSARMHTLVGETLAGLVPGATIDGSLPATDVEYELDSKRLVARVYTGTRSSRRLEAMRRIIEGLFPDLRYRGKFEYRVVTQSGERLNLQPVRVATGMPELLAVPVRPGMAGLKATVQLGSLVLVEFVDADPSRPVVTSHDAPDSPGWMPLSLELGGPGALGVARLGDTVIAGPYTGVITSASARIKAAI